ncbi:MAG TPA: DUF924 family protein [Caulobacteraceae bacterium]|nr:DUF924 family protein [Caulobacteraceae bacterium]
MEPAVILDFWFRELAPRHWFLGSKKLDADMRRRFSRWVDAALNGQLDAWAETSRGRLALILLLDQFTRNIHRGTPGAFAGDARAQSLVLEGLAAKMDRPLNLAERQFFYMPLVHAEDPKLQALSLKKFAAWLREAQSTVKHQKDHAAVIERFGRFPTRNAALGRASTPEEQAFLGELKAKAGAAKRKKPAKG